MDTQALAAKLKPQFDRDGFVIIRGFYNPDEMRDLNARLDQYITRTVPTLPPADAFYEVKGKPETLKQMQRMESNDSYFGGLSTDGRFRDLAAGLLGDVAVPHGIEWFNKPPTANAPTPPHQDGYYFMLTPNEAITLWLALDVVDEVNGCIRYVAGSHRRGVRPHARTQTLGFSQGITDYSDADRAAEVRGVAQPGDLLAHHSLTIHRADANTSPTRHRRALGAVYFAQRAKPDRAAQAAYQTKLQADLAAAGRI